MLVILILSILFFSVNSQLSCYECDPRSAGRCESPDKNNIAEITCTNLTTNNTDGIMPMTREILKMDENSMEPPFCYYLYLNAGVENETGYYRGCSRCSRGVEEFCRTIQNINGMIKYCEKCRSGGCNSGNFENLEKNTVVLSGVPDVREEISTVSDVDTVSTTVKGKVVETAKDGTSSQNGSFNFFVLNVVLFVTVALMK